MSTLWFRGRLVRVSAVFYDPNCMDGGEIASDSGYAVSRIVP